MRAANARTLPSSCVLATIKESRQDEPLQRDQVGRLADGFASSRRSSSAAARALAVTTPDPRVADRRRCFFRVHILAQSPLGRGDQRQRLPAEVRRVRFRERSGAVCSGAAAGPPRGPARRTVDLVMHRRRQEAPIARACFGDVAVTAPVDEGGVSVRVRDRGRPAAATPRAQERDGFHSTDDPASRERARHRQQACNHEDSQNIHTSVARHPLRH